MFPRFLHYAAALPHQLKASGEVQGPGGHQGGVFAHAVAGYHGRTEPLPLQHSQQGHTDRQESRLGVDGVAELLLRSLEAELRERKAHDCVGLMEKGFCFGISFVQIPAHAHVLRALAGEDKGDLQG